MSTIGDWAHWEVAEMKGLRLVRMKNGRPPTKGLFGAVPFSIKGEFEIKIDLNLHLIKNKIELIFYLNSIVNLNQMQMQI